MLPSSAARLPGSVPSRPRRVLAPPPTTYYVPSELTSPKFGRAFSAGCLGPSTTDLSILRPGPFAAFMTPAKWSLLDQAIADHRTFYYGDHGWFRRGKYYRVALNTVQFQPTLGDLQVAKPFRYGLVPMPNDTAPMWNENGTSIVICPNSFVYMRRFGIDAHQWTMEVAEAVSTISDRPIVIRWKTNRQERPLATDLHTAYLVIVFSSGAAVEALRAGVPIVTLAPWATTASMGLTSLDDIEHPYRPPTEQRLRFLWSLAEHQWTLPEIAAGEAWKTLHRGHL